ncbi:AAA family ATPase [Bacillus litorisediminis]|uniref:AAA family ATPase n=1 Tax=Bacillus litorisediminis TaxID=2922713 RepID=UPI001FACEEB5|nr:AAA family ATPase [Bacillus litorisediminis]
MLAYINAKDVAVPSDIALPEASCLVKMSEVNFQCFKLAFIDPESRIKLVTEQDENHHSVIERIQIFGGYLDGLDIFLSPHLNTLIGGRGTGKSTLLELIRYAIELEPKSKKTKTTLDSLIRSNLGIEKGRIEITVSSNKQHGKLYKIIKRYGDPVVITDLGGDISNLTIEDVLPNIEIYGQNEIIEIIEDEKAKIQILNRFLPNQDSCLTKRQDILKKLEQNRIQIVNELSELDDLEQLVQKLPGLLFIAK